MRMYFIFLENKSPGLHFAAGNIGLSSLKFLRWATEFLFTLARGRFRSSRASKVTDIGANRKRSVDFLLVRNSNFGTILHRFRDLTGFMCYLRLPTPIQPQFWGCSRCTKSPMLGVNGHMDPKLFGREIIFEEFQRI